MSHLKRVFVTLSVFLITFHPAEAQLCQGSLGDPIVNITFGAGANPGAPLTAASTAYQYVSTDCPGDGFYAVRNSTSSCFSNSWHTLSGDHTGNANGYFMLVNASVQPSAFYVDTVSGLCGGTTYEFAAWIMNVLLPTACGSNGNQPNLTFTIEKTDGTVLQSYNTNNISSKSSPTWQQFGFFFTTPLSISNIVLRIFNNAPGGCGNDLALDDITFRPCGPKLTPVITSTGSANATVCEGIPQSFTFNCTVSAGFNSPSYQWQQSTNGGAWSDIPGAISTSLSQNFLSTTALGTYAYRMAVAEAGNMGTPQCRIASPVLTVQVVTNPVTTVTSNSPQCAGSSLSLSASGGTQFQWSGPNNFSAVVAAPVVNNVNPNYSGKYYVLVTDASGCSHLDSVSAIINPAPVASTTFSSITLCKGGSVQLESSGGITYQWLPATGLSSAVIPDPEASPADTIQYSVIVADQINCKDTAYVTVNVIALPAAHAGPDKIIAKGNAVQLAGSAGGQNISYVWSPDVYINNTQVLNPVVSPVADTNYILTVTSNDGCGVAVDTMHVYVYKDIFIPTAFSPNGDGLNDTWGVPALAAYPLSELSVFNRYGEIVFQTKGVNKIWDGKYKGQPLPIGVYVYMIDLKEVNKILKGTITIVR